MEIPTFLSAFQLCPLFFHFPADFWLLDLSAPHSVSGRIHLQNDDSNLIFLFQYVSISPNPEQVKSLRSFQTLNDAPKTQLRLMLFYWLFWNFRSPGMVWKCDLKWCEISCSPLEVWWMPSKSKLQEGVAVLGAFILLQLLQKHHYSSNFSLQWLFQHLSAFSSWGFVVDAVPPLW